MSRNVDEDADDPEEDADDPGVNEDALPLMFEAGNTIIIPSRFKGSYLETAIASFSINLCI